MVIIRSFDPNGWALPLIIKADGKIVDQLSFFRSQTIIKNPDKEISLKTGFWYNAKVNIKKSDKVLIVNPPLIVVFLFALSIPSLLIHFLANEENDWLFYGTLITPFIYLLVILYYFLFRKNRYYNIMTVQ